jgi:hypothetical protein
VNLNPSDCQPVYVWRRVIALTVSSSQSA